MIHPIAHESMTFQSASGKRPKLPQHGGSFRPLSNHVPPQVTKRYSAPPEQKYDISLSEGGTFGKKWHPKKGTFFFWGGGFSSQNNSKWVPSKRTQHPYVGSLLSKHLPHQSQQAQTMRERERGRGRDNLGISCIQWNDASKAAKSNSFCGYSFCRVLFEKGRVDAFVASGKRPELHEFKLLEEPKQRAQPTMWVNYIQSPSERSGSHLHHRRGRKLRWVATLAQNKLGQCSTVQP